MSDSRTPWHLTNVIAIGAGRITASQSLVMALSGMGITPKARRSRRELAQVIAVAGGGAYSLALKSDGTAVAWGSNWRGQCNLPSAMGNVVSIAAGILTRSAGREHSPALALTAFYDQGRFSVLVQTAIGKSYSLEYKSSLEQTAWTSLPGVPGTGALQLLTDPAAADPRRFYRVRQY
jgi:hypothetical protein